MERGIFRYLKWQELYRHEKPFTVLIDLPEDAKDQRRTNLSFHEADEETVNDVRGGTKDLDIDTHGFTYVTQRSNLRMADFDDQDKIENQYLPECEELIRNVLDNVDKVHIFNWLVSRNATIEFGRVD